MKRTASILVATLLALPALSQRTLSLDSCRALAISNSKQVSVTKLKQEAAQLSRKAARTKYLPKVDAVGGYEYFSKEISLLNKDQKSTLLNLGSNAVAPFGNAATDVITNLTMNGVISPETAQHLGGVVSQLGQPLAQFGNQLGKDIKEAFDTNTHNIFGAAVMVRQPIYMGGAITAMNNMADIAEVMVDNELEGQMQNIVSKVDETYWLIVSLKQKQKLANAYCDLVKKLDSDVHKMIDQGVATYANGLTVDVKVNEAEMAITTVDNGLSLAKMLLCQQCGLPLDTDINLEDEDSDALLMTAEVVGVDNESAQYNRSELRLLENAVDLSKEATNLLRAAYRPQVALTGGYIVSNPHLFNGFENKFNGVFNVGILVRVPIWNWNEGSYKVQASKTASAIAELELSEAREMINLQVEQCRYKLSEANKRLVVACKNLKNAEENLRCANVGFREGVMESTEVMAAQTAWQAAQTRKIDAEIDVKLSLVNLKKALGIIEF